MLTETVKPLLRSVGVPWMISPSTPFLRLAWREESGENLTVEFVGYYKQFDGGAARQRCVQVVEAPAAFLPRSDQEDHPYRLIRVIFKDVSQVVVEPAFADAQVVEEGAYDWSAIDGHWDKSEPIERFLRRTDEQWVRSGICPNARMYQVDERPMLGGPFGGSSGAKRLLVLGSDSSVLLTCREWRWLEGQPLLDWQ